MTGCCEHDDEPLGADKQRIYCHLFEEDRASST